ncbi:aquaporin [Candidatus Saccharibacteria bacterium]|nr:aquaporin [Candidatus Saccharibacteria bacterium]
MFGKEKVSMVGAEFVGTFMLATAVLVVSNMFGAGTAAWYTAVSAGAALALIVAKLGHVSGAHVNPAVTIGMWTLKKIPTTSAVVYIASQLLGGAAALAFYNYATDATLAASGAANFDWRVFWLESAGAAVFGSGIAAAVSQKLEGVYAAFTIGASLTAGALIASLASAGFVNPAVALGNNAWDRTLVIAPIVGMVVGMNIYMWLFAPAEKKRKR